MLTITGPLLLLGVCSLTVAGRVSREVSDDVMQCHFVQQVIGTVIEPAATPCKTKEGLDENGYCNSTQVCSTEEFCFTAWRNNSNVITIVNRGCWTVAKQCREDSNCRATNGTDHNGVYFCCCRGSFCASEFHLDEAPPLPEESTVKPDCKPKPEIIVAVAVAVMTIVAVSLTGLYYCYRRRKLSNSELHSTSVNTPGTGCTVSSFPAHTETPSPHLLAVKARGRFGKVWRAQLEDRIVAVKTFNLSEKASWQNEQDIFCTPLMNTHLNILKFHTASSRGEGVHSELWLITEFYDRGSLADFLKVNKVDADQALRIIQTMACGMSFLHEDIQKPGSEAKPAIAHRDFKSKNVLLDHNLNAVVADFGLAVKFLPGESPGESHGQVGTLRYMAPEVLEGAINFQKDAFLRIDMYAFGLVMWEVVTRCSTLADCGEYKMPFEEELGTNPTIDYMQEQVVEKKLRPHIRDEWKTNREDMSLCDTMEECWDHDAEARLSAGCVEQRIVSLRKNRRHDLAIPSPTRIINRQAPAGFVDTNAMNQLNIQMNILSKENVNQGQPGFGSTDNDTRNDGVNADKKKDNTFECQNDHDSGTFVNDDTLSEDSDTDHLLPSAERADSAVCDGDNDSATSLLSSEDPIV